MSTSKLERPQNEAKASEAALFSSWLKQWLERLEPQDEYMVKMAPFLFLAKTVREEDKFFKFFFKEWFEMWPLTPSKSESENESTISSVDLEELTKLVKKNVINDFVYILAGFNRKRIPEGVSSWTCGFQNAADSTGPGMDFSTVDDDDDIIYVSSDEDTSNTGIPK